VTQTVSAVIAHIVSRHFSSFAFLAYLASEKSFVHTHKFA